MSGQWTVPAWVLLGAAAVIGVLLVLAVAAVAQRRRVTRALVARDTEAEQLRRRLDAVEERLAAPGPAAAPAAVAAVEPHDYVITRLGHEPPGTGVDGLDEVPPATVVPTLPPGQFADVVLREGVVRSAALLHGVRRALSPQVRDRIRSEVRRETKRARKARRVEQREAVREWQARQRAEGAARHDSAAEPVA